MEALILERMREGLLQKQDNLTEWLHATPLGKKKILLGPINRTISSCPPGCD